MTRHLLVASRGAWSGPGVDRFLADAAALAGTGAPVTVLLVADAVPLIAGGMAELLAAGAEVLVDRFAAAQRGVAGLPLPDGARWADLTEPAELFLDPAVKVVWH
ncbi:hypothetical protein [Actinokineospora sp. UTMC 2448]|uniref:hypothetical protein n=1 Tax=Actinokineospora sp. UTMC 2448 TaxID=2268449 RepID=UPI002164D751|nr:hypothetical protein [Actinokineospora sp. UTMC 2448]UVS80643.1 hypothetical protein Actkin_04395 [Actinokineospora sp. UTMC 2448]